ncbi:peptide methionine sulfoxide reductase [Flavobacterium album]|uniref:peptide-methionine (S)-S-oxide reductase n=1 Tax=Flavobacterium album TaxID=2175091 RepID=A0A2S1R1X1_9FLAO|nr:peptide-methionine (S)-S-oxide reductase [Flavobacterium album]AWH86612.1 peptide methionine sulfoxide reductase [Flavobacterium album]
MSKQAGFGGGCHWCTEAVFSSLKGIVSVEQGWIASDGENSSLSEGVIVTYEDDIMPFETLIAIHLYTHSSTSMHPMRDKYRSAVYTFNEGDRRQALDIIRALQPEFDKPLITRVLPFVSFTRSRQELLDYYFSDPTKPFCELYINPKLKLIMERFLNAADHDKLQHLT